MGGCVCSWPHNTNYQNTPVPHNKHTNHTTHMHHALVHPHHTQIPPPLVWCGVGAVQTKPQQHNATNCGCFVVHGQGVVGHQSPNTTSTPQQPWRAHGVVVLMTSVSCALFHTTTTTTTTATTTTAPTVTTAVTPSVKTATDTTGNSNGSGKGGAGGNPDDAAEFEKRCSRGLEMLRNYTGG